MEKPYSTTINSKKILAIAFVSMLAVLLLATLNASAQLVRVTKVWSAVGTNTATWVDAASGNYAQVTIKPNGTQDGTVTLYACPVRDATTCVTLGTVAGGSSTTVTFGGPAAPLLYLTLTGNTPATGAIDAYVSVSK